MNTLCFDLFWNNPNLPYQINRFCSEIPDYVQARSAYLALAAELERSMGQTWYLTYESTLNQYWAAENWAYYLFGLHLRQEVLDSFQKEL